MKHTILARVCLAAFTIAIAIAPSVVRAEGPDAATTLREVKREIVRLTKERAQDLKVMQQLKTTVDQIEARDAKLMQKNQELEIKSQQTQQTQQKSDQQLKALQAKVEKGPTTGALSNVLEQYYGQHRVVIAGSAAGTFMWDRERANNSFGAQFEPLFLFRLNDWIAFEGEVEAKLPSDAESEFNLETAMAHLFLCDNLELQAGKWFLPFGDYIEDVHPFWVNRFVSNPLPFREGDDGGLVPFTDVGLQARGGYQWGKTGQDVDYVAFISNGPNYDPDVSPPMVGQMWSSPNNVDINKHSKGFGARVRLYPLPVSAELGRGQIGVSTYDGMWANGGDNGGMNSRWFKSVGISGAYAWNNFEARGEYVWTWREMPSSFDGMPMMYHQTDHREGWYLQLGYQLARVNLPTPADQLNNYLHRTELVVRYSGQNQRAFVKSELPDAPGGDGGDVSPSTFVPHAREVALGLDYFITPSIVWKLEYDIEIPHQGGYIIDPDAANPVSAASAPNDHAFMTQLAIGF
jgi:hypothetical protein